MATGFNSPLPSGKNPIAGSNGISENQARIISSESAKEAAKKKSKLFLDQPVPPYHIGDTWITPGGELFACVVDKESGNYSLGDFVKRLVYTDDSVANEKRRVFVTTPSPPYDVGDLWLDDGEMYRCFSERQTGDFHDTDWGIATDYTDDSYAKNVEVVMNDSVSELRQTDDAISQSVQTTITTLHNEYLTAEQIAAINEENLAKFAVIEQYMTEQRQFNNRFEFVITTIIDDGVTKVKNTLVSIDANGIEIAKSGDPNSARFTNSASEFLSYGEVKTRISVDGTTVFGKFEAQGQVNIAGFQIEMAEENGVNVSNWFWIGG